MSHLDNSPKGTPLILTQDASPERRGRNGEIVAPGDALKADPRSGHLPHPGRSVSHVLQV